MDLSKLITKEMKDEKLLETVLSIKLQELLEEKNNRVDAAVGTSDPRKKDMKIAKPISLLLKKIKGTITPEQETELDATSDLFDYLDTLNNEHDVAEAWLEDPLRTLLEIQDYDVAIDPSWSTL